VIKLLEGFSEAVNFFQKLYETVTTFLDALKKTTEYINSVSFDNSPVTQYIGYFRYAVGDELYLAFCIMIYISLGITLWKVTLAGVEKLKAILPW
jgi:hypothetical protein